MAVCAAQVNDKIADKMNNETEVNAKITDKMDEYAAGDAVNGATGRNLTRLSNNCISRTSPPKPVTTRSTTKVRRPSMKNSVETNQGQGI